MKRNNFLITFLLAVFLAAFLVPETLPQGFDVDAKVEHIPGGKIIKFSGTVDTTESYTSNVFYLSDVDDDFTNSPPSFGALLTGTDTTTRKISAYLVASNFVDGTFSNKDTLLTADSADTEINKTFDLNGNEKKFYLWKLKVTGATGNDNTDFDFRLVFTNKDANKEDD